MEFFNIIRTAELQLRQPYRGNEKNFEEILSIFQRNAEAQSTLDHDRKALKETLDKLEAHKNASDRASFPGSCASQG